jgi:sodium/proline symporter
MTVAGALSGILVGGSTIVLWSKMTGGIFDLYALVPGFIFSLAAIFSVSLLGKKTIDSSVIEKFEIMEQQVSRATQKNG